MTVRRASRLIAVLVVLGVLSGRGLAAPTPARAADLSKPICTLAGLVSTAAGKLCSAARHAGSVLRAGQKLLGGHIGGAVETLTGGGSVKARAFTAAAAFTAAGLWVMAGARFLLHATAGVISSTTRPELRSTWFSVTYWRMAGISALLTLPFLFAAAIQALMRSDVSLLLRSTLGYLPLGLLAVSIAAPLTQLLLAASDEMSGLVSSAAGYTDAGFAHATGVGIAGAAATTFPLFFVGVLAVAATLTLWIELLVRSAAVYVIVLMLPLFFAAVVWPARRVWAVRAVEVLVALILSKFVIVAVLALGTDALGHAIDPSVTAMLAGTTLIMLAAFSPWAMLRLLPLHELAAGLDTWRHGSLDGFGRAEGGALAMQDGTAAFADHLAAAREGSDAAQPSAARVSAERLSEGDRARLGPGDDDRSVRPDDESAPSPAQPPTTGATSGAEATEPGSAAGDRPEHSDAAALIDELDAPQRGGDRLPGMEARWQAPNMSWPTIELGPEASSENAPDPEAPLPGPARRPSLEEVITAPIHLDRTALPPAPHDPLAPDPASPEESE